MRTSSILVAVALTLVVACDDVVPTAPLQSPAFTANPNSAGAVVVRYDDFFQLALFDPEQELLAFHNWRNAFPACGEPVTETRLASVMEVINGNDALLLNLLFKARETYIWVWHSTNGSVLDARCTTPIAKGVGQLAYTDNDVFAFLADRSRANIFGYAAQANLVAPDGTPYHYNGISRFKWQPNSGDPNYKALEIVKVKLTPKGK